RYLYVVLADHDFQEGLKNYRDLAYLGRTLDRWQASMVAFDDMIDARRQAHDERMPRVDALLAADGARVLRERRDAFTARLNAIEHDNDVAALGTDAERAQWERIARLEAALAQEPPGEDTEALRERLRLVKGVLQFRLNGAFRGHVWEQRRDLKSLD